MTEDEMVGWHHRHNGHEFEQAPGVGDGQGSLACSSPWGLKETDMTERLNLSEDSTKHMKVVFNEGNLNKKKRVVLNQNSVTALIYCDHL